MKYSDIPEAIVAAGACLIGEYRGSQVERVEWVDRNDGKAKGFVKCTHLFEMGIGGAVKAIRVDEPIPKTVMDPNEVKVSLKRGSRYLMSLQILKNDRGNLDARLVAGSVPVELT